MSLVAVVPRRRDEDGLRLAARSRTLRAPDRAGDRAARARRRRAPASDFANTQGRAA
jgi:hypothetical protein